LVELLFKEAKIISKTFAVYDTKRINITPSITIMEMHHKRTINGPWI